MARLAWFSPLPPSRSGIAAYSAELVPLIARRHDVDTFIDPHSARFTTGPDEEQPARDEARFPVFPSRDFVGRHRTSPYDLIVYQLGNAPCHDYIWPYLTRFPGLTVLHDGQLHQARAKLLLTTGRADEYRSEFTFCHPDASPGIAEMVIAALGGSLFFLWPLVGVPVESSRMVAVHSAWLADQLHERYPHQQFDVIRMGVADPWATYGDAPGGISAAASRVRRRHGIAPDRLVFASYGMVTPEKRVAEILEGLRAVLPYAPNAHVMLVGQPVDHYDVEGDAHEVGVEEHVTVTGYVPDEELSDYLAAADVCLCLRWPTSRETSASWLRCLAAHKPTIVTELAHTCEVPALDPRSWTTLPPSPPASADPGVAVCVAIDILDEQHSLGLAMRRLACDEALRRELGTRARAYWQRQHTLERMADDYELAIAAALQRPDPDRSHLPAHLISDGTALTGKIVEKFGVSLDALDW